MSLENMSDIHTKNNEYFLHRWIEHKCEVVFITYSTFDVDVMDVLSVYTWNYFVQENSASYVIYSEITGDHIETCHNVI